VIAGWLALLALTGAARDTTHGRRAVVRVPLDTAQVVNFRTLVEPDTVYVGQQATYELGVFIDESVRDRLRRMEALPPELRGLMAYEPLTTLTGFPWRVVGRRRYEAHISLRAVFPLAAGRYAIAPARLVYAMPLSYSFFSREESFELRSDSTVIIAIEPPAAGRPADYMGAVGSLRAEARLDTSAVRAGDAMHLTVRIFGAGNVKLFPRPLLDIPWATEIQAGERVTLSGDSIVVRGVKEFDWVITPTEAGRHTLGAIRYPYFDPDRKRYDVALTIPIGVSIAPGTLAAIDSNAAARAPAWELRAEFRGALPPPLYRRIPFVLLMILLPAPALAFAIANRPRRERRKTRRIPPDQTLREIVRRRDRGDLRPLRRAFLDAVAARLRAPASALAEPEALRHSARRAGTSGATASAAATFVSELNAAAFAQARSAVADPHDRALRLYRAIDTESRRWKVPARRMVIILALGLAAAGARIAGAIEPDSDEARFAAGIAAYDDRRFADASQDFGAITAHAPRAADAWANLGTAAFAAGDTARAVAGWQRALRLEPLAADVRERLDITAPAPASSPGAVPPIPPLPLILVASLLWAASWIAIALRIRRRSGVLAGSIALTALGASIILGVAGGFLDARLSPRGLAVLRRDLPLRILPALGAERASQVRLGETVRVIMKRGPWTRVRVDRDRDGWVPGDGLLPLTTD
jgi:tetratricopeptide (TPR) repeat protein